MFTPDDRANARAIMISLMRLDEKLDEALYLLRGDDEEEEKDEADA